MSKSYGFSAALSIPTLDDAHIRFRTITKLEISQVPMRKVAFPPALPVLRAGPVYCAVDGAAVQLAHDVHPDTILLDIMMPGMDGVEVSQRLRADPATADIPIVVMSAQDRLQATSGKMAVDDRLSKPFDILTLYATVDRWAETGV